MPGPDLTNKTRYSDKIQTRKSRIYGGYRVNVYQVRVAEEHCSFLRFLWWENYDLGKPPVDFEMLVHIFGVTSPPACSTYLLKRSVIDYEVKNNKKIEDNLKKGF